MSAAGQYMVEVTEDHICPRSLVVARGDLWSMQQVFAKRAGEPGIRSVILWDPEWETKLAEYHIHGVMEHVDG